MSEHRWTVVAVYDLGEEEAERLHELHGPDDRESGLRNLSAHPSTVRGPICSECRVHWRDVHARPDEPWPCPGERPEELGGPLVRPEDATRMPRQQRRAMQRRARKEAKKGRSVRNGGRGSRL